MLSKNVVYKRVLGAQHCPNLSDYCYICTIAIESERCGFAQKGKIIPSRTLKASSICLLPAWAGNWLIQRMLHRWLRRGGNQEDLSSGRHLPAAGFDDWGRGCGFFDLNRWGVGCWVSSLLSYDEAASVKPFGIIV